MSTRSSYPTEQPESMGRSRFVTLCQQLLALAVVMAVLTPAARTVTMEVRPAQPLDILPADISLRSAEVPVAPVAAEIEEYDLSGEAVSAVEPAQQAAAEGDEVGHEDGHEDGHDHGHAVAGESIVSEPVPVEGYGTVGVTWSPESSVGDDAIHVEVRTKTGDEWSEWTEATYRDDHAPDATSPEGRSARPGTDAVLVGHVDAVQVKVATQDGAPEDMKLAVIDPGTAKSTATEKPAIDTGSLATAEGTGAAQRSSATVPDVGASDAATDPSGDDAGDPAVSGDDSIELQTALTAPRPQIYSRAQWGANEKLRDASSLRYYEVRAGFVHHTVNANDYTAAEVPGIIRSIYNYHVKTRGWSDIGYNFLIDRFGRIWEGRAGGVDKAVVGAHTEGYNNYGFGAAAIGNFETVKPGSSVLNAYGALFGWKLSLSGVSAAASRVKLGSKYFPAISGHRDTKATACPGKYLYAVIPSIRSLAAKAQTARSAVPGPGKAVIGNYAGDASPDLLLRRKKDSRLITAVLSASGGKYRVVSRIDSGISLRGMSEMVRAGDWDGDGRADLITRRKKDRVVFLYRGKGGGRFHAPVVLSNKLAKTVLLSVPGDVTGDGKPDLVAQNTGGTMRIYPGKGRAGLGESRHNLGVSTKAHAAVSGTANIGVGMANGDTAPDSLIRNGNTLRLYYGKAGGGWSSSAAVNFSPKGYDWVVGIGTLTPDRQPDLIARVKKSGNLYIIVGRSDGWRGGIKLGAFKGYDMAA